MNNFPTSQEKLYLEGDFPNGAKALSESPKALGISRADLWVFAGLVALDEIQQKTKALCINDNYKEYYTCNEHRCYSAFPKEAIENLFQTGREDCEPKVGATDTNKYLTGKLEKHPNPDGSGNETVNYFQDEFGLGPRQGLALLGIHTIGHFNPTVSRVGYGWLRKRRGTPRNQMFNHEYYKVLGLMKSKTKDGYCTGTMGKFLIHIVPWYVD